MKTLSIILLFSSIIYSQEYPSWYLTNPDNNTNYYCGFVETEFYKDSSFVSAKRNAAQNAAINKSVFYKLNDTYLTVGGIKTWMDTEKEVVFDTLLIQNYFDSFFVVDSFQTNSYTFVIISDIKHNINRNYINAFSIPKPDWVENIPKTDNFRYSVGVSESYFSPIESWENSEENARIEFAKESKIKSRQIQKKLDSEYSDVVNEITEATISNVQVVARWIDNETKLYFTLIKIPLRS
jgi:hypothetical protein